MNERTRFHEGRLTVSHLMSEQPVVVRLGTPVGRVAEILDSCEYRHVLVSDSDGNVAGVVSGSDVLSQMAQCSDNERWKEKPVESFMTTKFIASSPNADAADVANMITRSDIQCVPVMEGDRLVGVMTSDDLLLSWSRLDPLLKEAASDAVTDLASRATFDRRLYEEWERARRRGQSLGLVLIDVDRFKSINDECGHLAGDAILCMLGSCLRRNLRVYDIVARYGGDEFAALCCNCQPEDIRAPIQRLQSAVRKLSFPSGIKRKSVTLSIGAAIACDDLEHLSPELLVEAADRCVYHSKRNGRARSYWTTLSSDRTVQQPMHLVDTDGDSGHPESAPGSTGMPGPPPTADRREKQETATQESDRQLLDDYARQISGNMERLIYLQCLASRMAFPHSTESLGEVAKSILPDLRNVTSAQAIVLVMADYSNSVEGEHVGDVSLWDGQQVLDEQTCRSLVNHFRTAARQRPVVKNRLRHSRPGRQFPGLDSFVVAQIAERDTTIGWLLALQRIPPTEIYGPEASWELNDFEFGTDEAGLIGATATLLALHHRQSQTQKKTEDVKTLAISSEGNSDVSSFVSVPGPS